VLHQGGGTKAGIQSGLTCGLLIIKATSTLMIKAPIPADHPLDI